MKISKQWREISFQIPLSLSFPFDPFRSIKLLERFYHFANCECLKNITHLALGSPVDVWDGPINNDCIKYIVESEYMKNLTSLQISRSRVLINGARYIAKSVFLKNLTSLNLAYNGIRDKGV